MPITQPFCSVAHNEAIMSSFLLSSRHRRPPHSSNNASVGSVLADATNTAKEIKMNAALEAYARKKEEVSLEGGKQVPKFFTKDSLRN